MLTSQCFLEYCTTIIKVHNDVTKISTDPKLPLQSSENIKLNIALRMYSFEECSLNNKSLGIASGLPGWHSSKESTCQCKRCKRHRFDPWVRKIPSSSKWQTAPVFLPGKFHGQRSLVGYNPWDHKELDTTKWPNTHKYSIHDHSLLILSLTKFENIKFYFDFRYFRQ